MASNFMITVDDTTESAVQDALKRSGINCTEARESTAIHDGYALTELMIASTWNYETGYERCEEPQGSNCGHRSWQQLSEEQKHLFASRLAGFLNICRIEELEADLLLRDTPEMAGIRLSQDHEDDEDRQEEGQEGQKGEPQNSRLPMFIPVHTTVCNSEAHDPEGSVAPVHRCRSCDQTFCNSCTDLTNWDRVHCPLCNASE